MKQEKIKDWYLATYPDDEEYGNDLYSDITFEDLYNYLTGKYQKNELEDLYEFLFMSPMGGDTLSRERIFEKLAEEYGVSYDDIYALWTREKQSLTEANPVKRAVNNQKYGENADKYVRTFAILSASMPPESLWGALPKEDREFLEKARDSTEPTEEEKEKADPTKNTNREEVEKYSDIIEAKMAKRSQLYAEYNNSKSEELRKALKGGVINYNSKEFRIPYSKMLGRYRNTKEHSFMLYNVDLATVKEIAESFGQESFIFGVNHEDGKREIHTYTAVTNRSRNKIFGYRERTSIPADVKTDLGQNDYYSQKNDYAWKYALPDDAFDSYLDDLDEIWEVKDPKALEDTNCVSMPSWRYHKRWKAFGRTE